MNNDEIPKKIKMPEIRKTFFLNVVFSNKKNDTENNTKLITKARTTALDCSIKINGIKIIKIINEKNFQNFPENFNINKKGIERKRLEESKFLFANDPVIDLTLKLRFWLDFKTINS